jgi:hypothetical protein
VSDHQRPTSLQIAGRPDPAVILRRERSEPRRTAGPGLRRRPSRLARHEGAGAVRHCRRASTSG